MKNNNKIYKYNIDFLKDSITSKYVKDLENNKYAIEKVNEIYNLLLDLVKFNKEINPDITDDEFEYIYQINCKLENIVEEFENSIYEPNTNKKLDSREKVYNYRKIMIDNIKYNLNFFINKK